MLCFVVQLIKSPKKVMSQSVIVPDELGEIIAAVIEFYEDAVDKIDPSVVFTELRQNLSNWITKTQLKIEEKSVSSTELTPEQRKAYEQVIDFIENSSEQNFRGLTRAKKCCYVG